MPIIGNNNIEPTSQNFGTNAYGMKEATLRYTAAAGDQVDHFYVYGGRGPGVSVTMAVYTVVAGLPIDQVGGTTNIPITGGDAWYDAAPAAAFALTAGVDYCVAFTGVGFPRVWYDNLVDGISNDAGGLEDPWIHAGSIWRLYSAYANVTNVAPPSRRVYYPCRAQLIT